MFIKTLYCRNKINFITNDAVLIYALSFLIHTRFKFEIREFFLAIRNTFEIHEVKVVMLGIFPFGFKTILADQINKLVN